MPDDAARERQAAEDEAQRNRQVADREADRARAAEVQAASRTFARLRVNVTDVSPGYVTCSIFQSANGGTNWACSGSGVTFDEDWFAQVYGAAEVGDRFEFELVGIHRVTT